MLEKLMPRSDEFFDDFDAQAQATVDGARLFHALLGDYTNVPAQVQAIKDAEHRGDAIAHSSYERLHKQFITPFDRAEIHRDVVGNALDTYLGVQSNRMNRTIQTLTLMSTVMLPLNLIAGIYGMNFHHMPELSWEYGYPFALGLMVLVATSILVLFRLKRWL